MGSGHSTAKVGGAADVFRDLNTAKSWSWGTSAEPTHCKAPALTGVFYCFNGLTDPINQPSIPGTD